MGYTSRRGAGEKFSQRNVTSLRVYWDDDDDDDDDGSLEFFPNAPKW